MLLVFTTVPNAEEGELLATKIVDAKLAACVQILPQMTSVYVWEGTLRKESEHLLFIKTLPEQYGELERFILTNHSYDVPEVASIEASHVSEGYSKWLREYLSI
jgi:periplasmic divalent cation tolerance protein